MPATPILLLTCERLLKWHFFDPSRGLVPRESHFCGWFSFSLLSGILSRLFPLETLGLMVLWSAAQRFPLDYVMSKQMEGFMRESPKACFSQPEWTLEQNIV